MLSTVTTILSRPTRLVKGKSVSGTVREELFESDFERDLFAATKLASSQIDRDMSIPEFLTVSLYFLDLFILAHPCSGTYQAKNVLKILIQDMYA